MFQLRMLKNFLNLKDQRGGYKSEGIQVLQ